MFKFWLCLGRMGAFHYDGVLSMAPSWWPRAQVFYPDTNTVSVAMPIGNAIDMAAVFQRAGAQVIPVGARKTRMVLAR